MYISDPPCCAIPGAKSCNQSCCCSIVANFGFDFFDKNRGIIFPCASALSVIALVFASISVASLSHNGDVVKDTFWTRGKSDDFHFYVGLNKVVTSTGDFLWDNVDCSTSFYDENYCSDCKEGVGGIVSSVIINFITLFPTITGNLKRSTAKGDLNCTKFFNILSGTISTLTMLVALSEYQSLCFSNLPTEDPIGKKLNYTLGPGFICLLIPQIIKPIEILINILTPVARDNNLKEADSNA
jgi:hypothetical protein